MDHPLACQPHFAATVGAALASTQLVSLGRIEHLFVPIDIAGKLFTAYQGIDKLFDQAARCVQLIGKVIQRDPSSRFDHPLQHALLFCITIKRVKALVTSFSHAHNPFGLEEITEQFVHLFFRGA